MKCVTIPPAVVLALWLAIAFLLPGTLALFGATPAPAVAPTLALTEAAGAFSVLAAQNGERRIIQVEAVLPEGADVLAGWAAPLPDDADRAREANALSSTPVTPRPIRV